ncbi:DotU family type IV/VI secretion system protein [Bryobacter aggregatus]|uniref:DotU family type IV/VI secretion system protein n=1 Tax=Bryobacter aggregatus TaxID=360054 RepID=UPI00068BD061|nr:DotU family type IV/VI secretion system protein [Bryobacter aggregatus]
MQAPSLMERETLAVIFQEPMTAVVRVWSNPQMTQDPYGLREHMKSSLKASIEDARRKSFSEEETKLAMFAIVAYLDETILTQNQPAFADWRRKPLQEELFGVHIAGEIFFQNLENIIRQPDSLPNSDLLEIYALAISLGFQGRYSAGGKAELKRIVDACMDKCRRIRGAMPPLSPSGELPPTDAVLASRDPWFQRMVLIGGGLCVMAVLAFVVYKVLLGSGADELRSLAQELTRR